MPTREKKDNNPVVLKLGVALALSFAGFLCSRLRNKYITPSLSTPASDVNQQVESRDEIIDDGDSSPTTPSCPEMASNSEAHLTVHNGSSNSSPSTRHSGDKDGILLPEFNKLIEDFDIAPPMRDTETPHHSMDTDKGTRNVGKDEYEQEIQSLRSMVKDLREQIRCLEIQLLEYYGLVEQEVTVMELQNRLKINNVEARALSLKIESLQAQNRRLEARVADYLRVVDELEDANARIKLLKTKLKSDGEKSKEQISRLEKRVVMLDKQETDSSNRSCEPDVVRLQRLDDLENETEELRNSKYELAWRLESKQILATSMLEDLEVGELKSEVARLKEEKEKIENEVERLQSDRCSDAEELVYLRWVNACLRYELRNYQPPPDKTVSRDLSKSLNPKFEAKAKQLILEYANKTEENDLNYEQWSPSQSYRMDSGEPYESLADAYVHHSKKPKIFDKLRRLVTRKENNGMHYKPSTLVRSRSVQDLGKAYGYVVRRNSIFTPSQSLTSFSVERSSNTTGSSASSSRSNSALGSQLAKGPELSFDKPDLVGCVETLKMASRGRRTHKKSASYGEL